MFAPLSLGARYAPVTDLQNANEWVNLGVSVAQSNNDNAPFIALAAASLMRARDLDASYLEAKNRELLDFMM